MCMSTCRIQINIQIDFQSVKVCTFSPLSFCWGGGGTSSVACLVSLDVVSDTVSLGYCSLPLTVTVSVETHLQSKLFHFSIHQAGIPSQPPCLSCVWSVLKGSFCLCSQANCVAWFQWIKDIKQKKKEEKWKEMEKNIQRSPRQIDIEKFYKESSSSEEERRKTKKAIKKVASPPKVLCCLVHLICLYFLDTCLHSICCKQPNLLIFGSRVSMMSRFA